MITLDTLALVCWLGRQKALSQAAHDAIDRELHGGEILISAISALEIAEFVKDHDKRFEASVESGGSASALRLTRTEDGHVLEPITSLAQYRAEQIERDDPGPTVRAAWEAWLSRTEA